ncbi:hypothetical protein AGABI1DRAFT_68091 [Agaricus bisporus var. burnettii JB137-S8]|uniref:LIM zinc-binding domain-containing protein n=1 Tax=Agaricus bisporus var. burnettii (strain JB137-S8 / ATCC MYA-4627 / FGSC 10392) TaxID=597362 RepID=K5X3P0_AGABU|nr:uncharacterized protein AGABI1DRAFT_68091 [Agaricus bisporus var. burnettii JB137-S8]EKM82456.1 hypothetical protein AGABI1DRAFT_68091 [Agaricus bisporus var. burnettii JB137-S8]
MEEAAPDASTADAAKESTSFGNLYFKEKDDSYVENKSHERDNGLATTSGQPHRSNTVQVPPHSPENKPPKLPTRAKTTNDSTKWMMGGGSESIREEHCARRAGKTCIYQRSCRRCMLPIEKQAVSSSDGQLKGKYHKECFNCHVCHKTFPDKSFYVFDGKPLCAYHYHEANRSLCAATRCGQPIEGPCALSHTGDKYHPEHMTCEHPGLVPCKERLKEYWEINGKMLCEWHAAEASRDQDEEEEWVQTSKAKKRITRFMNLSSMGGSGGEENGDLNGLL